MGTPRHAARVLVMAADGNSLFGGATFNFSAPDRVAGQEEEAEEEFVKEEEVTEIHGWQAEVSR